MTRLLGLAILAGSMLPAQHVLYNDARDKTAQDAVAAAKAITSTSVTATQMKNLQQMETDLIQNEVAWTETSLKRSINGFRTWSGVQIIVDTVGGLMVLYSTANGLQDLTDRLKAIDGEVQKLRGQAA